ncbi:acyl-CoA N-acyltransferase [Lindgomyces ingoldianus]|uniref:Acyl-CoA N-acyltransferase n=1 Tax=Lindgomyces ingoldianus TaxID=673940 RepID=A0ACB6RCA0_9PLEO|nr:acyl-CoA N-acyltransferase [Lindgomyces ingoldianus]KAF2476717.1 acyl-CoA N-acyltransferase [Lindgomyces ingoldianus]
MQQTMPVAPGKRFRSDEIEISLCEQKDVDRIAEGLYTCFPEVWWSKMEPPSMRPPSQSTRERRLAKRLLPSFSNPNMNWVKATLASTGTIIGIAGWMAPGNPIHNIWRRSATAAYNYQEQMSWSDEEIAEMWEGVNLEAWEAQFEKDDGLRRDVLGDEGHWYLGPLFTFPEFQGRGVGRLLLDWAIQKADATVPVTPLYLESAPTARAVYMKVGFVSVGEHNFLRRGPRAVKMEENEKGKVAEVKAVEDEVEEAARRPDWVGS